MQANDVVPGRWEVSGAARPGLRTTVPWKGEAMEIGLLIRYGKLVPGREHQAIDLFNESMRYFQEKVSAGALTYFEPFFLGTSDLEEELGFFIVKGPAPEIFKLMEEEQYLVFMQKAMVLVEHLRTDLLSVGERIAQQVERALKVNAELGI
jgi:hypothetical protein